MKIPCEIIRDLLPLYVDGVCSEESKKAVEEHLQDCKLCRDELNLMTTDIQSIPSQAVEEEPVKAAAAAWKQGKHRAFLKGCIITMIALGLVAAILCHCLIPIAISPKSFQSGGVFQHRVFRWGMPVFMVRLLCAKPMQDLSDDYPSSLYDQLLWSHRACTVNGEKCDIGFYFKDGLTTIELMFQDGKAPEWSEQLLKEFREYYGPETEILDKKGNIIYHEWALGDSLLRFATGDFGKPCIYLFKNAAPTSTGS